MPIYSKEVPRGLNVIEKVESHFSASLEKKQRI